MSTEANAQVPERLTGGSRSGLRVWIEAARPKTLPAAIIPVLVGTALARHHGGADVVSAGICLLFSLLVQIGTNFANDYYDFVRGADTPRRVGPRRAVAAGLISKERMHAVMLVVFGASFAIGLMLVAKRGWILLPIGVASILSGIAYTGGPWPLGYNGLGDLFVFLFFGLVAVGTTFFVQTGWLSADAVACGAAIGLLAANILVANNYRDAESDAAAGKRTLVVRFGRRFAVWQYGLSALIALAAPAALVMAGHRYAVLAPLVLAPWAAGLTVRLARSREPQEQIRLLGATARFLAAYGVILSAAILME